MKKIMFNDRYGLTQAVLDGRKTQTRRIITPQPIYKDNCGICWKGWAYGLNPIDKPFGIYKNFISGTEYDKSCRRYRKGEVVAVAQSYNTLCDNDEEPKDFYVYPNDIEIEINAKYSIEGLKNKLFVKAESMPHQIRITNVRLEKLQDISEEDCLKEGISKYYIGFESDHADDMGFTYSFDKQGKYGFSNAKEAYANLIDRISGKGTWESNPYVFVYDFELVK